MSQAAQNPDRRPLPPGWVTQYEPKFDTWFYINTSVSPPVTPWTHPADSAPRKSSEQPRAAAHQSSNQIYNTPDGGESRSAVHQGGSNTKSKVYGANYGGQSNDYPQPPSPPKKKHHGLGTGAAFALGAVGILGGALLLDAMENKDEYERCSDYAPDAGDTCDG